MTRWSRCRQIICRHWPCLLLRRWSPLDCTKQASSPVRFPADSVSVRSYNMKTSLLDLGDRRILLYDRMISSADDEHERPWLLRLRSSTGFIVATVWMSNFTVCILSDMLAIADSPRRTFSMLW